MKKTGDKLYAKWKSYDSSVNICIDKKRQTVDDWIFSRIKIFRERKVELHLSNYATKTDLKNATEIGISSFVKKADLASLKSHVDKLDIDELKNVPNNLSN